MAASMYLPQEYRKTQQSEQVDKSRRNKFKSSNIFTKFIYIL